MSEPELTTLSGQAVRGPLTLANDIIAYENDDLDEEEVLDLFRNLIHTGLAWRLQGHYGRTAVALIEAGVIDAPTS